jgi:hypothetical protein
MNVIKLSKRLDHGGSPLVCVRCESGPQDRFSRLTLAGSVQNVSMGVIWTITKGLYAPVMRISAARILYPHSSTVFTHADIRALCVQ